MAKKKNRMLTQKERMASERNRASALFEKYEGFAMSLMTANLFSNPNASMPWWK